MANHPNPDRAQALRAGVLALLEATREEEQARRASIDAALPGHRASAVNLAHYLGLRKRDLHRLQLDLCAVGLSSLGRCEGHVHDLLLRVSAWLAGEREEAMAGRARLDRAQAERILHANTRALFGPRPPERHVYIMVTAPDAAEADAKWADALLAAGADLLRINGAHQSPAEWAAVAATFKARAAACGKAGRIVVDLPGPKLRTEIRQTEPGVLHFPRCKDAAGRTLAPTVLELVGQYRCGAQMPVPPQWIPQLEAGDVLVLTDAGGRQRRLEVSVCGAGAVQVQCDRSLYIAAGLPLVWRRGARRMGKAEVGALPEQPRSVRLAAGDSFLLNESGLCGDPAMTVLAFPEPEMLSKVQAGERVVLDDGRLVALVQTTGPQGLSCRVKRVAKSPLRLRSGKGIAFPDSALSLGQLGPQDEAALGFALEHADAVGVSFVTGAQDVALVGERIRRAGRAGFGMILKLETRGAVSNLADILFEALKYEPVGLMIARGDLAVELSFERLAEMQEELLWFGEACHLPVVWATQVLDSVAHSGLPTRAEVTDAAMSMRAECVMLNKGPFIAEATRMLADIIRKMEAHQYKKRALYRPLAVARRAR
ncbi:MAG: pyruvate kinase [Burkholderiales bacterium]|nr:pyruvate kinase [Burkholderiales bacterium]